MEIAFIGFGEAARAWSGSLSAFDRVGIRAYDILLGSDRQPDFERAAAECSVRLADSAEDAVTGADLIFSAVTAAQSLEAAKSIAAALRAGQVFFDINSVSPGRKTETSALVEASGAAYVDMAVMAPVHPARHRTPVLLAGTLYPATLDFLEAQEFSFDIAGPTAGDATMIKMIRSLFVKGLEALTVGTLTAALKAGCYERIFTSLAKTYPGLDWATFPAYHFERIATHGIRRAEEMRESAATLQELGLPEGDALATAIADLHHLVGTAGLRLDANGNPKDAAQKLLDAIGPHNETAEPTAAKR